MFWKTRRRQQNLARLLQLLVVMLTSQLTSIFNLFWLKLLLKLKYRRRIKITGSDSITSLSFQKPVSVYYIWIEREPLDLPQVVLSQEEKETEREALDRASKCERSEAREASTTCFARQEIESSDVTVWREASCCFHELVFQRICRRRWRKWIISCALWVLTMIWHIYLSLWNWTSRKLSKY